MSREGKWTDSLVIEILDLMAVPRLGGQAECGRETNKQRPLPCPRARGDYRAALQVTAGVDSQNPEFLGL